MKIGWRFRAAFLLAKNEDLVSSQIAARILRFDNVRFYLVLLVFRWGVQFAVSMLALLAVVRGAGVISGVFLSLIGVVGVAFAPVFEDFVKTFRKMKGNYVSRLAKDSRRARIMILDAAYWFWMFKRLGIMVSALSFMVVQGEMRAVVISLLVVLVSYVLFLSRALFKARVNAASGMVSYLAIGGIVFLISVWLCSGIKAVLGEAGAAYASGEGELLLKTAPNVLFSDLSDTLKTAYSSAGLIPLLALAFLLLVGLMIIVRRSRVGNLVDSGYRSEYIAASGVRGDADGYCGFIFAQLSRQSPRFGATELNFLIPFEVWLLLGISVSLGRGAPHPGSLLVLAVVEVYIIMLALHRAVVSHYPDTFELGSLLGAMRLFRRLPRRSRAQYYRDLEASLKHITLLPSVLVVGVMLGFLAVLAWVHWGVWSAVVVLAAGIVQGVVLWPFLARICLGAPVDAFEVVLHNTSMLRRDDSISDLSSLAGYRALRTLRMVPLFVVQTVLVFVVTLLPIVGLVQGDGWWGIGVAALISLAVGCVLASRKYGGYENEFPSRS